MNPCATVMADAGVARLLMAELLGTAPEELTPVPLAPGVDWLHLKYGFATFESRGNSLYTLGWFPTPSTQHCIRYLNAAACQYMMYQYGDWPAGLESTVAAVTEDALASTPIAHIALSYNMKVLKPSTGQEILLSAGSTSTENPAIDEFLALLRGEDINPVTERGRAAKATLERS